MEVPPCDQFLRLQSSSCCAAVQAMRSTGHTARRPHRQHRQTPLIGSSHLQFHKLPQWVVTNFRRPRITLRTHRRAPAKLSSPSREDTSEQGKSIIGDSSVCAVDTSRFWRGGVNNFRISPHARGSTSGSPTVSGSRRASRNRLRRRSSRSRRWRECCGLMHRRCSECQPAASTSPSRS
jgi:hypothetical protein